jgi:hypothetical protein
LLRTSTTTQLPLPSLTQTQHHEDPQYLQQDQDY